MNDTINIKSQLKISIPIAFESLINILMTFVDTLVISLVGTTELAALGAMSVVINLMQMGIQTINISTNTLVAKSLGEKDYNKASLLIGNSIILTLIISIITIIIVFITQPIFPPLFKVDIIANTYLIIRLIGFIQSSLVTVLSGYNRTIGKQKNILHLRIFAVITNLILDIIAVKLNYGIIGVALVTIFIDTLLSIYLCIYTKNNIKLKFVNSYFNDIIKLFKWNFIERIASKLDNFIFNLIVARIGNLEYAVHVILIQISNIYNAFIQGFGDGITISVGIATGNNNKNFMIKVKKVAKKIINYASIILTIIVLIISIIVMHISLNNIQMKNIFFSVLPIFIIDAFITMYATYYFSILRGYREFNFLAKRNMVSSIIKILIATILSFTSLGIIGVWIGYLVYGLIQFLLSKKRYNIICK